MSNVTIKQVNVVTAATAFITKSLFPLASPVTAEAALVTQFGATIVAVNSQTSQLDFFDTGIQVSGPTIALAAKIDGFLLAMGTVAIYGSGTVLATGAVFSASGIAFALTITAGVIAAATNKTTRNILTDPDFWCAVGTGGIQDIDKYLFDSTGIDMNELLTKLAHGYLTGEIVGLEKHVGNILPQLQSVANVAKNTESPLILDLDGDGIETTGLSDNLHFDHNANGFAEQTGWVGKDDGLLVFDRNGNGQIDGGKELFGNNTVLASGANAANGFAALAELDTNADGKVTSTDAAFADLRVWKDADHDAVVDTGELLTLTDASVQSLNTTFTASTLVDANGNSHKQVGTFTKANGTTGVMNDVWFTADTARTVDLSNIVISDAIAALPNVAGFGNVHNLHDAMALDTGGNLQALVTQWIEASSSAREAILDNIIYAWTGSAGVAAGSRGPNIDARKMESIDALLGETFSQVSVGNNPAGMATIVLIDAFAMIRDYVSGQLLIQTDLKPMIDSVSLSFGTDGSVSLDTSGLLAMLESQYNSNAEVSLQTMGIFGRALANTGSFGSEVLHSLSTSVNPSASRFALAVNSMGDYFSVGDDAGNFINYGGSYVATNIPQKFYGMGGNDNITGSSGADTLDGGSGNDTLNAGAGADILRGGTGNDSLDGGLGADLYLFNLGDGQDTINDNDSTSDVIDTLEFGAGLNSSSVIVVANGSSLTLSYGSDVVTVQNYLLSTNYSIETIRFGDGVEWNRSDVFSHLVQHGTEYADYFSGIDGAANNIQGISGNDTLNGAALNDILNGGAGDDKLYGKAGNDTLIGGPGNDTIEGGLGSDTYVFNLGDGHDSILDFDYTGAATDTITFGAGLSAQDAVISFENYGRKKVVVAFQDRKQEPVQHPLLAQSIPLGLAPLVQARLLARAIRGELDTTGHTSGYVPFMPR